MTQNDQAIEFLKAVMPDNLWVLVSISPIDDAIETKTFSIVEGEEALAFINKNNGKNNLYWHVNPPMTRLSKKASKTDIKEVIQFHVDIDPRAGEDLENEQSRIRSMLENPPNNIPKPTCIIFSGGGYQAFWKLKTPIEINGSLDKAEEIKLYNVYLEDTLGADRCHNIDRLMRLPGTINIPNTNKRKKGRKETMAIIVSHDTNSAYDIDKFKKSKLINQNKKEKNNGRTKDYTENVVRLNSLDELDKYNIAKRIKDIIVNGRDAENPKSKDDSRSAWLFDCVCELIRNNVPDDIIYSIITDEKFLISESVLEKNNNIQKYALRQINRGHDYTIAPELDELNQRYAAVLNIFGKCKIIEEIHDPVLKRSRLTKTSFEDFKNAYINRKVQVGETKDGMPIFKPLGKWWIEHPKRKQYKNIIFAPGSKVVDSYNLWQGYNCDAVEGDCSIFLDHIKENICNGNDQHYEYLIGWMANCVQNPGRPGYSAIVLRGKRGTGKSIFAKEFGTLFGRHMIHVSDPKHLVGSFNAHLRDCVLLFGDEAFYAGDKKHESILKMLVTEETIAIEPKGVDMEICPNFTHIILASNDQWVIPAGADERRFFVLEVGDNKAKDHLYFSNLSNQMENGGREALLHYLLNYDINNFEVRNVPNTDALHEQKLYSMGPEDQWIHTLLDEGILPNIKGPNISLSNSMSRNNTPNGLYDHARKSVPYLKNYSDKRLGAVLKKWGCKNWSSGKHRGWMFPPLVEMRTMFEKKYQGTEWPKLQQTDWSGPENVEDEPSPF